MAEPPKFPPTLSLFKPPALPSLAFRPMAAPTPPPPPPPQPDNIVLTEEDIVALGVILTRLVIAQDQKAEAEDEKKAAEAKFADADKRWNASRAAFAAFGYEIASPTLWPAVRGHMGDAAWNAAFARARGEVGIAGTSHSPPNEPPPVLELTDEGSRGGMPTIREIALAELAKAGEGGVKAADIREFIRTTYDHVVHYKTVGMTLYRLLKSGLARRDGHVWFSAKPSAGTENPGDDTPGSEDGLNEEEVRDVVHHPDEIGT